MKIGLIGAGNMATALARGLSEPVLVADAVPEKARALAQELGGEAVESNTEVARRADLVVLCHKPAQLQEVAEGLGEMPRSIVSILAATTTRKVEAAYPGVPVYRFIPNIPVEVRRGVLCYTPGSHSSEGPEEEVLRLFGRLGTVIPLAEPLVEPATALMSCGPAFLARVVEAMVEAGTRHGIPPQEAALMTIETMAGTAAYLAAHELDAAALRRRVATPGGLTERGLRALEVEAAFNRAVDVVVEGTQA